MGFDTVLTQFATKTQQNEGLRKGPSYSQVHGSGLESVEQLCRGVAQPGSAPALGAGGPRFKSARPDQFTNHESFQPQSLERAPSLRIVMKRHGFGQAG
jgi:hypothetical protein